LKLVKRLKEVSTFTYRN